MPLTPFHLGPGLFFGMLFIKYLDLISFLIGNVVLDIEPGIIVLSNIKNPYTSYSHHGFFHTIIGAFMVSVAAAFLLDKVRSNIRIRLEKSRMVKVVEKSPSYLKIFSSLFLGTMLHIGVDSLMHYDVFPFWPSKFNPLLRIMPLISPGPCL